MLRRQHPSIDSRPHSRVKPAQRNNEAGQGDLLRAEGHYLLRSASALMSARSGSRCPSPCPPPRCRHLPVTDTTPGMQLLPGRGRWLSLGWPRGWRGQRGLVLPGSSIPPQTPPHFPVFLANHGGRLQGTRTTASPLPAPHFGALDLSTQAGGEMEEEKGGGEGTHFPADQPSPAYPLCGHSHHPSSSPPPPVPTRFMLPS